MNHGIRPKQRTIDKRWLRLGVTLALAALLLFIPATLEIVGSPQFSLLGTAPSLDLSRPFGVLPVRAAGGITLSKTTAPTVEVGGVLTYTLTVTNNSGQNFSAGDFLVYEKAPTGTTIICPSNQKPANWVESCRTDNNDIAWSLFGDFNDGTSVEFIFSVSVNDSLSNQAEIVNDNYFASANGSDTFGPPFTTTVNAPVWAISKTASDDPVQPGQIFIYTITATNIGALDTTGTYTITDSVPLSTTVVDAPGADSTSPPTWITDTLVSSGGGSKVVTYSVQVDSPLADGTKIVNDGYSVSGGGAAGTATNSPITVTVSSSAILTITKTANPSPVQVGNVLTYTLTVTNNTSTGPAQNVVITDTLSNYVSYLSAGFGGGATGTITDAGGNPIIWTLADPLAPNSSAQVTVTVRVSNTLPDPPQITNNFRASADNAPQITDSMNVEVEAGDVVTLTLDLSPNPINNLCGTTVATATLLDEFGNPVSGVSVTIAEFPSNDHVTPLTSGSGSTNGSGVFTVTFRGVQATASANMFALGGGESDNKSLTINTGTPIPTSLNLSVSPNPLSAGGATGVVTATLTDCQSTPQPVAGATVNLSLSDTGLANFPSPPPPPGTTNANGVMTATLVSTSTGTANGTVTITGTSTGSEWDLQDVEILNIDPASAPVLSITKLSTPADGNTVSPGGTIVYNLVISNSGTAAATGMVITDDLHTGVGFVTGSLLPGGSGTGPFHNGGVVTFSVPSLAVDDTITASIEVTVTAAISGTDITNTARGSYVTGNFGPSNMVSHQVITSTGGDVYIPIILKNQTP